MDPHEPYADSLSFLLSQVGARSAQLFGERVSREGITAREFAVLSLIGQFGPRTQQQLADALGMHRNPMVGLVDGLEAANLVRRTTNSTDRRAFFIELTATGAQRARIVTSTVPELDAQLAEPLSNEQVEELRSLLRLLAEGLQLTAGVHPHLSAATTRAGRRRQ